MLCYIYFIYKHTLNPKNPKPQYMFVLDVTPCQYREHT